VINLIKLCVGVSSVQELEEHRAYRRENGMGRPDGLNVHRTRMMPKRRNEIIKGGSLYWVMSGLIQCRQKIVDLDSQRDHEGKSCCDILMDPEIVRTIPQPKRPFQGWRYFRQNDAPSDLKAGAGDGDAELAAELTKLGLI